MIEARLPAHYDRDVVDAEQHAPWLMAALLEEGDTFDLRWLLARFGEERLSHWVADRGPRQLSARSLAYWLLVLGVAVGDPADQPGQQAPACEPRGSELWPR